jgi:hypothetical protein
MAEFLRVAAGASRSPPRREIAGRLTASGFLLFGVHRRWQADVMLPTATFVLMVLGGLGFTVLIVVLAGRQTGRVFRRAQQLAFDLGLTPPEAKPRLGFWPAPRATGTIKGRPAELFTYTTGSGKSRMVWCALAVRPTATGGLTFRLVPQGFTTRISQLFGAKEITVGDPAFDAAWFIQTNQPDFLAAALLPEICSRIATAVAESTRPARTASFKLEQDRIVYAEVGDFGDEARCERFRRVADVLGDFAAIAEVAATTARR